MSEMEIQKVAFRGQTYQVNPDFDWQAEAEAVAAATARLVQAKEKGPRASFRLERRQYERMITGVLARMLGTSRSTFKGRHDDDDQVVLAGLLGALGAIPVGEE